MAVGAAVLGAHVPLDDELGRDDVAALGDIFADATHLLAAAPALALFVGDVEFDDLAREVLGEGSAAVAALLLRLALGLLEVRHHGRGLIVSLEQTQLPSIDSL